MIKIHNHIKYDTDKALKVHEFNTLGGLTKILQGDHHGRYFIHEQFFNRESIKPMTEREIQNFAANWITPETYETIFGPAEPA
jgi:hypothetical protein